jgi:hypothetical protein
MDDGKIYVNNEKNELTFILNGDIVKNPFNMLIGSKDRLLINY